MGDAWFAAAFGAHYPLLYAHRDEGEARRCLELLPRLAPLTGDDGRGLVLDLGCGDGRHLAALNAGGVPVVGVDLSAALLARAVQRRPSSGAWPLVRGDMRHLALVGDAFASVLSLFTAFGYFGPLERNLPVIGEVARVLRPGGHWFLDYFDGDAVRRELSAGDIAVRERDIGPLRVSETRRLAPAQDQVCKDVVLSPLAGREDEAAAVGVPPQGLAYTETVALFDVEDLDRLAAGLKLVRVAAAGSYDGAALGAGDRWLLVYRYEGEDGGRA